MSEKESLFPQRPTEQKSAGSEIIYHDSTQTPRARALQYGFVGLVALMVMICIALSIYRGIELKDNGAMYFLLGLCLVGYVAIEIILILFIRRDHLPREKFWFLYFVGFCVILEAIFTDILLFQ